MDDATHTAAWVPDDDPTRGWGDATPATAWVLREARQRRVAPLLLTHTHADWRDGPDVISRFGQKYPTATRRSRPNGRGPVLVYAPDYELMDIAVSYAKGSAIAVVESRMWPLIGWAIETKALNLMTGEAVPESRSDSERESLEMLHFVGNNGWHSDPGKERATQIIGDMIRQGEMRRDVILGYMVAKGRSGRSVNDLAKLIDRLS